VKYKQLNQKHDCWNGDLLEKYDALYQGGHVFRNLANRFLNKNALEPSEVYQARIRESTYEPFINSIVNQFASQLFSSPFIVRSNSEELDIFYSEFKEKCNDNGDDLLTFTRAVFINSLIKGCAWVLTELPNDGEPLPEDLATYNDKGLGIVKISTVEAEDVFDWEVDDRNNLIWVITHKVDKKRYSPYDTRNTVTETWKIYDQADVETFQISYEANKKPNNDTPIPTLGKISHRFPKVPFVCLKIPAGLWLVNRLADAQIEHFRMNNALGWSMRRACYPTAVYKSNSDAIKLNTSNDNFGIKIGESESFDWISPPVDSFTEIAKRVDQFKNDLHSLAMQMSLSVANGSGAIKRSGESKKQDSKSTEIILYAYADVVKAFIEELYELISDARGDQDIKFSIEGMNEFTSEDSKETLETLQAIKDLNIPMIQECEPLQKELARQIVHVTLPDLAQNVKDEISDYITKYKFQPIEAKPIVEVPSKLTPTIPTQKPAVG